MTTTTMCEIPFVDSGPHPGCAEFAEPVDSPCGDTAAFVFVLRDSYPDEGTIELQACTWHAEQIAEHDPGILEIRTL